MNKADVKIGSMYKVKVSGVLAEVRINGVNPHGGWDGMNTKTHRRVRIASAGRLRGLVDRSGKKQVSTLAEHEAEIAADKAAKGAQAAENRPRAKKAKKATKDAKSPAKRDTGKPDAKPMSLLNAAAHLLSLGTRDPMRCKDIVDLAVARGLWTPGSGKTPASTLHAAMSREITTRGDDSRFRKTEPGKFTLAK